MFSRQLAHPMGSGVYTMVQISGFVIQACHKPVRPGISVNAGFAIRYSGGTVKILSSGMTVEGPARRSGNTIEFPGGEVVRGAWTRLTFTVPGSRYMEQVIGLCGGYRSDGSGGILDGVTEVYTRASGQQYRWGGPFQEKYQSEYVEGLKVDAAASLFTSSECPYNSSSEPESTAGACPEMEAEARRECPVGACYDGCVADVVLTCDRKYIEEARVACKEREELDPAPGVWMDGGSVLVDANGTLQGMGGICM